jgi:hypothetical protein
VRCEGSPDMFEVGADDLENKDRLLQGIYRVRGAVREGYKRMLLAKQSRDSYILQNVSIRKQFIR